MAAHDDFKKPHRASVADLPRMIERARKGYSFGAGEARCLYERIVALENSIGLLLTDVTVDGSAARLDGDLRLAHVYEREATRLAAMLDGPQ